MAALAASRQMSTLEVALRTFGARLFEAAPGLVTWVLLLAPAWIPIVFTSPGAFAVAGAVLVFDVYWLFRSVSVMRGVYRTYSRMRSDMGADWLALCKQERAAGYLETDGPENVEFYKKFGFIVQREEQLIGTPTWYMWRPQDK